METETRLQQLEQKLQELLSQPTRNATQQLTYPLDPVTQQIINAQSTTQQAFPVGYVFISVDSTNPATTLGYGTWTAFGAGRCLVGVDAGQSEFDTVEETGGAKTHQLGLSEMPEHGHGILTGAGTYQDAEGANAGQQIYTNQVIQLRDISANGSTTPFIQKVGGNGSHNNLQPYITVYMFKRTA